MKYFLINKRPAIISLLFFGVLIVTGLSFAYYGVGQALEISTYHLDGAYQTASGLFRVSEGQIPGKDFFPYLGVGVTFLLYPFFFLFGSNLAASTAAAFVCTAIGFFIAIATVLYCISSKINFSVMIAVVLTLLAVNFPEFAPAFVVERINPGNSLRPIRSLVPYLGALIIALTMHFQVKRYYVIFSFLAALSLLWSNDYGIPTSFSILLATMFFLWRDKLLTKRSLFAVVIITLLSYVVLLTLITGGHVIELLKYNFVDVAHDQYWYFGGWSEEQKILVPSDIVTKLIPDFGWPLLFLPIIAYLVFKIRSSNVVALAVITLSSFLGGALAIIGGHREAGYASAYLFFVYITIILFFISRLSFFSKDFRFYLILALCFSTFSSLNLYGELAEKKAKFDIRPDFFFVDSLGGYLPSKYKPYIEKIRDNQGKTVVEEYWGLWSAISRKNNQLPVDSIIHALGDTREEFIGSLRKNKPEIIVTTSRNMSLDWQPWNVSANYWFYEFVLKNYAPEKLSATTVVWSLRGENKWSSRVGCEISKSGSSFRLITERFGFYEVRLRYSTVSPASRSLLMVNNNYNSPIDAGGYLALDKTKDSAVFPVFLAEAGYSFPFKEVGKVSAKMLSCEAWKIDFDDINVLSNTLLNINAADTPYELTDNNWVEGVGRRLPAFFVERTPSNLDKFQLARKIKFKDGRVVDVSKVDVGQQYINIWFSGPPLDGYVYGYPNRFDVIY